MTENELRRMQDEALRRTREMQRRAQEARLNAQPQSAENVNSIQPPAAGSRAAEAQPASVGHEVQPHNVLPHQPADSPGSMPRGHGIHESTDTRPAPCEKQGSGALEFLFRDKEKTLILGLLLLLMDEKTDNSLLLALMYLLL